VVVILGEGDGVSGGGVTMLEALSCRLVVQEFSGTTSLQLERMEVGGCYYTG